MEIFRSLARRKLRSTLTILGIVIGIFALTTMGAMAENVNALLAGGGDHRADGGHDSACFRHRLSSAGM